MFAYLKLNAEICWCYSNIKIMDENIANKSITILIAEDEESNFLLLKTILKRHCNILHAKTGKRTVGNL